MTSDKPKPEETAPFPTYPLEDHLKKISPGEFDRGNRPRDRLWASEIGSCARAVWYNWHHPRPHDENFSQHRGALGHAVEWMLEQKLAPILVAKEVSFTNTHASGRADFVVRLTPKDEQIPVEIKSTYGFDWAVRAPKRAHVLQLQYYLSAMPKAPFGLLVYVNLANYGGKSGHFTALWIPRDDVGVKSRIEYLRSIVDKPEPPACENLDDPKGCWDCGLVEGTIVE